MEAELQKEAGAKVDGVYYCPHHATEGTPPYLLDCNCRKPKTGMIEKASEDLDIDIENSYVIGDRTSDLELGFRAGCKSILVLTGYGKELWKNSSGKINPPPAHTAENLLEAVNWILKDIGKLHG